MGIATMDGKPVMKAKKLQPAYLFSLTLLLSMLLLVSGCSSRSDNVPLLNAGIPIDGAGTYTGFSDLPEDAARDYTAEKAGKDGCLVLQDSKITKNRGKWEVFLKTSEEGQNTAIRIAMFYTANEKEEKAGPFFYDIYYEKGKYYLFDSSATDQKKQPYSYLLSLEGKFGNPKKDSGVVILTDDASLTFDTVMRALLSSSMEFHKDPPLFRIVMFQ